MCSNDTDCTTDPVYALPVRDAYYHTVAALTFLVWHAILTFDEEVEYIWPMPNRNPFKWMYMYVRYVSIAAHVIHTCLMERLTNGSNPPVLCNMWHVYIIAFTQSLATSLEFLLAIRVFALYNRSRRVAVLLLTLILMEVGGAVRMVWLRDSREIYGTCLLVQPDSNSRDQSLLGFMVHCTLIGLTLFKYVAAFRAGCGRTPLVSLVIRDGSTAYATMLFMLISVLLIFDLERERVVVVFFWATALLSITARYLVVSMERLARREMPAVPPREAVLTTEFNMEIDDSGTQVSAAL